MRCNIVLKTYMSDITKNRLGCEVSYNIHEVYKSIITGGSSPGK